MNETQCLKSPKYKRSKCQFNKYNFDSTTMNNKINFLIKPIKCMFLIKILKTIKYNRKFKPFKN